jgi:hypothetical protein
MSENANYKKIKYYSSKTNVRAKMKVQTKKEIKDSNEK